MLACICEPDNSNAADNHECTEKAKPTGNWYSGASGPDAADLQKLAKSCGTPPTTTLTAAEIQSEIAHLRSVIHIDGNDGYLGHYSGTGCNGSKGHGICVKFTALMTADKTQFETKTWVAKFVAAAQIMDSLRDTAAKAAQVNAQLKTMKAAATAAVQRSRVLAATLSQSHTTQAQKKKIDIKNKCETHKSKTACLGAKCAWKGKKEDDGPCIPTEA
ncbi:Trypanosomal VSG domain containing protein, putative [Trypanosoma equiperdum]|uniref:Trypanosomal VSG domain containing protein, putative n=1 Tax=Trypanosoma equiperdum TaxID=5694 RepID=A0A1G4IAC0_TRYEQ|nr:Trypanosomal VSG domain containing protein, putative [Trypanosoma equiperdum]